MITILNEVLFKVRVSFDVLVTRNNVFSDYIHRIDKHLDVVVEIIGVQSSVEFDF